MSHYNETTTFPSDQARPAAGQAPLHPMDDLVRYAQQYTRERPEVVALACFGVGFILGWKLKPW